MQTSHQLGKGDKYKSVIGTLVTVYRYSLITNLGVLSGWG